MRVAFSADEATTVVLPGADMEGAAERRADVDGWAAHAAATLAAHHESRVDAAVLAKVLAYAQRRAVSSPATDFLIYEPVLQVWAPGRFTLLGRELDVAEQRFLDPESVLPPQRRLTPAEGLGLGCSVTAMNPDGRGTVGWLFVMEGCTFFAALDPLPAAAVVPVAAIVETMLETVRIDDRRRVAAASFDARALVFPPASADTTWRV